MTNVSMLDRATTPTLPSSPNVSMRLLLGLLTGLLLGTGLAFALEWFYPHVRSSGGLEAYTGVPVLADLGRRYAGPGVTE
jgi:capsular polysaccharide biosynthesis protein